VTQQTPAPPQTPQGQSAALAERPKQQLESVATDMGVMAVAGRPGLERIEAVVTIPADFQYAIKRRTREGETVKVGITADGYDYINRALGESFFLPQWVHDQEGRQQRNPIHRKDYIYLRLGAVWYTPLGQLVMATEDVEVDFILTWMDARINSYGAEVVVDQQGLPVFDAMGNPALKLSKADELKALKTLSQLRTFGPRYAQTVGRVRLLKMASGIRSLPIDRARDFQIRVVSYRDQMTPQDRIAKAQSDSDSLYGGRPDNIQPLSAEELTEAGLGEDPDDRDPEQIDRDLVEGQQQDPAGEAGLEAADAAWEQKQAQPAEKAPWAAE
jgi:hypothetical protein